LAGNHPIYYGEKPQIADSYLTKVSRLGRESGEAKRGNLMLFLAARMLYITTIRVAGVARSGAAARSAR
jgi:hypothetical protein